MRRVPRFAALLFLLAAGPLAAAGPAGHAALDAAIKLFEGKRYPDAQVALERIVAAEPGNARACYHLGRTLELRADAAALPEAVKWLQQAAQLEPQNSTYLGRYGGASLLFAERTNSLFAARRGRDAMEQAIRLNPADLEAREGLFQFYQRTPWPLGSSAKAADHLQAIRQRDPTRAGVIAILSRRQARDYAGAFRLCEQALAGRPDDYNALYQLGGTALESGEQLGRGVAAFEQCLTLEPPTPASPSPSVVWQRLGAIHEKRGHPDAARAAYAAALRLDSGNREAAAARAILK